MQRKNNPTTPVRFDNMQFRNDVAKKRLLQLFINLDEAAKQTGVSKATLSRIENLKLPDIETFGKLCKWLGTDMNKYFVEAK